MNEVKEFNGVTIEILEKLEELRANIKNSMMHGEVNILKGIVIFEVIFKEFNPSKLDREEIDAIENFVRRYVANREEMMQKINPYVHYGVNRCFLLLESYNRQEERIKTGKKR